MAMTDAIEQVGGEEWLEPVDDVLGAGAKGLESLGEDVMNTLHGAWLGHPAHPAITDVPVGSWTAAVVMDAIDVLEGGDRLADGADTAIAVGLVGALGAAVTGLADWHRHTSGRSRRMGALHGVMNVGATLLYGTSLVARRNGDRSMGRWLAGVGYGMAFVSAMIGGHLVYGRKVGINNAPLPEAGPKDWAAAIPVEMLPEDTPKAVQVGSLRVVLVRHEGRIHCLADRCSHMGGPLSEGKVVDGAIQCPWHGSCFRLDDGSVESGPSAYRQPRLDTRVRRGWIEVRTRD